MTGSLSFKKPIFWIIVISILAVAIASVYLLMSPKQNQLKNNLKDSSISDVGGAEDPENIIISYDKAIRRYSYSANDNSLKNAELVLYENNECAFTYSALSSLLPFGKYEETTTHIVMKSDDGKQIYTFNKSGESLIFDAENSSTLPKYAYEAGAKPEVCVPDGAVFTLNQEDTNQSENK